MSNQTAAPLDVKVDVSVERKKPRLLALLFCDFTNMTADGKPNLLGVFDRIFVNPEKPVTPFFTVFVRVAEVVEPFEIMLFAPDNSPIMRLDSGPAEATYTEGLARQVQAALGFQFEVKKEGNFWFDVSYKGTSLGGASLAIEYRKTEDKHSGTDTYI